MNITFFNSKIRLLLHSLQSSFQRFF